MKRVLQHVGWMALCCSSFLGTARDLSLLSPPPNITGATTLQVSKVTGKVTDETGNGMPGVSVSVKGTSNGTTTNEDGVYVLGISADQGAGTLVFSFIGYANQEQLINNRSTINVSMTTDLQQLSEVVIVGYGSQEKRDVTSAISS